MYIINDVINMNMQKGIVFGLFLLLVINGFAFAVGEVFSNRTEQEIILEGNGTPGDPYMIYDVNDLQNMSANLTAHYALANDIDASESSGWNDGAGFDPVGTDADRFTGSFDGRNHTIYDLYTNRSAEDEVGLFGAVGSDGEVNNVGVVNADIVGNQWVGLLVGVNYGEVSNSFTSGSVTGDSYRVGGLIGNNEGGTVSYCYSTADVTGAENNVGGLVGLNLLYGVITDSYALGNVSGVASIGGLLGRNIEDAVVENSYAAGWVSGSIYVGGLVGDNSSMIINSFYDSETTGQNDVGKGEPKTTVEMMTQNTFIGWNFTIPGKWIMAGYPHLQWEHTTQITTVAELQMMKIDINENYTLMNDIDASSTSIWNSGEGFEPVGTGPWIEPDSHFTGSVDGQDHEISGVFINRPSMDYIGILGYLGSGGEIHSVRVIDADVSGRDYIGRIMGFNEEGTVSNSYADGYVSGRYHVGGFVGYNYYGTVSESCTTGNVSGDTNVGGLVGYNGYGTVQKSYATGNLDGSLRTGGLVGYNGYGTVSNSYSRADVMRITSSSEITFGGFVGENHQGEIINCYSTGSIVYEDTSDPTDKGFAGDVDTDGDYEMTGNYWDRETSGQTSTAGNATGMTTSEMKTQSTFSTWDFDEVWHMISNITYPLLRWQPLPEPEEFSIDMLAAVDNDGWNFVSFNIDLVDTSLESILYDIDGSYDRVMYYDASTGRWSSYVPDRAENFNNLQSWDKTMGVWIRVTEYTTLTVEGYVPTSTDITLQPGWNMVGLPSAEAGDHGLPTEVTRVGYFDAAEEYNLAYMEDVDTFEFEPGNGYWIYNDADYSVVWTVDY